MGNFQLTQTILNVELLRQLDLMGDLVILLYRIETFRNDRIALILVLPNLHENSDHILNPVTNAVLTQNGRTQSHWLLASFRQGKHQLHA